MSHFATLRENWDDRRWWAEVALPYAARIIHDSLPTRGVAVLKEDWDTLIILDACRYDMFSEQHDLPGTLDRYQSRGSNTPEFLQENFVGRSCRDTVYVTANPQVDVYLTDECFKIISVWQDHWDEDANTVPPGVMTEAVLEAHAEYPNKRIIAHYIQPHYPFIGDSGREELGPHSGMELSKRKAEGNIPDRDEAAVWTQLSRGVVDKAAVWRAYRENLSLVLPQVEYLSEVVSGRIVVTSDHGNALGERAWPVPIRLYGHPRSVRIPSLVDVPWLVIEGEERRDIRVGDRNSQSQDDQSVVEERLADLGYT